MLVREQNWFPVQCCKTFLIPDYSNDNYFCALTFAVLITTYLLLHSSIFHFVRLSSLGTIVIYQNSVRLKSATKET